jgi:hypothetical protein
VGYETKDQWVKNQGPVGYETKDQWVEKPVGRVVDTKVAVYFTVNGRSEQVHNVLRPQKKGSGNVSVEWWTSGFKKQGPVGEEPRTSGLKNQWVEWWAKK